MGIHNITHQNIILNAINKIYFVFSQCSDFTYDILNKYLSIQLLESTRHKLGEALKSQKINGETLMFFNESYFTKIQIYNKHQTIMIKQAINQIFNYETFSAYIATYPLLKRYQHVFIFHKIFFNIF
eukprot:318484_1